MRRVYPARVLVALAIAVYGFLCAASPRTWRFLDGVDLIIHEAGHVLFTPFGEFLYFLGGSLAQVMLPLAFVIYFWRSGQGFAAAVTTFWVAQSLFNLSVYVADARAQALDLLGGEGATHDWNWLLGELGLLAWDRVLGGAVFVAGFGLYVASVAWALHEAGVLDLGALLGPARREEAG